MTYKKKILEKNNINNYKFYVEIDIKSLISFFL